MEDKAKKTGQVVGCPVCNHELPFYTVPGKPGRVRAFCNHGDPKHAPVAVIETDIDPGIKEE